MKKLCYALIALLGYSRPAIQGHAGPAAGEDHAFFASRGISFYASFEESLTADYSAGRSDPINPKWRPLYQQQKITFPSGRNGNCASAESLCLVYDPVGIFAPDKGSVSFWFRPVRGDMWSLFQVTAKEWGVGPNSRLQMDLYHAMFLFGTSPLLRPGFYRALIRPALSPIEACISVPELHREEWHHFVWVWENTEGMRGYLDGEQVFDNWGTVAWIAMMTPSVIKLGSMSAIDELVFFRHALPFADVQGLRRGTLPGPRPEEKEYAIPEAARAGVAHSYGLDEMPAYPLVAPGTPVTFTAVDFDRAVDGRRPMLYCLDGNRASCWPDSHVELSNSDYLDITYPGGTKANYFRIISDGNRFALSKNGETAPFWTDEVRPERDGWADKLVRRVFLDDPVRFDKLRLDRKGARIGEFYVCEVCPEPLNVGAGDVRRYTFSQTSDIRSVASTADVYALYHSHPSPVALAGAAPAAESDLVVPGNPLVPFHLLCPPFTEATGVAAVGLELAFTAPRNRRDDVLRVRIVDPVTPVRDLVNTEFKLQFDAADPGAQVFRVGLDMPDVLFDQGTRLWVWLVSRDGSDLILSDSRLALHTVPVARAAEEMVKNTMRLVAHTYSWSSEGHIWSRSYKWPGDESYYYAWSEWAGLLNIVKNRLAPDNTVVGTYWHAIRPITHRSYEKWVDYGRSKALRELEHTRFEAPETWPNPAGAPEWALYQNELLNSFLRIVRWWHDNRLVEETGILGGYGDDTQFTGDAFWVYSATGDRKLFRILEAVTNGTWKHSGLHSGFPTRTNDVGHDAEEVVGAWPIMIVADYGNPKYIEMTMETMSLVDFFTTETALGHRHLKSWYLSATQMKTQGRYGVDNLANSQFALLGHALAWYNRCPKLVQFYREWCDAWMADFGRAQEMNVEGPISVRMPDDIPIPHVGAMSSQTMQHHFFVTGLLTGDSKYIDRALRNDDGVFYRYYRGEWDQGMLLRNFAFMRHLLLEDERLQSSAPVKKPDVFTRYLLEKDKQILANEYRKALDLYAGGREYLYTHGQPSLDRLWGLFVEPMFMGMLGGHPTGHRRSSTWPGMAISYVDAGGDLASLVLENRTDEMKCLILNFNKRRKNAVVRLWQLVPGRYEITAGPDGDGDDRMDALKHRENVRIERASRVTVPVPFGTVQVVHVRQLSREPVPALLPDLAIGTDDLSRNDSNGTFEVLVHNVGSRAAGPFEVALLNKRGGAVAVKTAAGLDAPVDLRPRRVLVRLPLRKRRLKQVAAVSIRPFHGEREITTENNRVEVP